MKTLLVLVLGFLATTCLAGKVHAQAAASAGGGAAAASASAAVAPVVQQPVVVQQAVPFVVMQRSAFLASGCGLGANVVGGCGGGVSAAVAVGGVGGHRIRGGRTVIRQRVRVR